MTNILRITKTSFLKYKNLFKNLNGLFSQKKSISRLSWKNMGFYEWDLTVLLVHSTV